MEQFAETVMRGNYNMKNAIDQKYSRRTIWIHWISALLIFIMRRHQAPLEMIQEIKKQTEQ